MNIDEQLVDESIWQTDGKWHTLVESAYNIIVIVDRKGVIQYINKKTKENIINTSIYDYMFPEYHEQVQESVGKVFETGRPEDFEIASASSRGQVKWYISRVGAIKLGDKVVSAVMIFTDITKRKEAEEILQIKNDAIESSINGIVFTDLKGNINYINHSLESMWDYCSDDEIIGRNIIELWEGRKRCLQVLNEMKDKGSWIGELVAKKKNSDLFDVQLSSSIIKNKNGKPMLMMFSFIDITENKQSERRLKQIMKELVRSNEELEQYAYIASHDLKEPLRTVISYLQLLEKRYKTKLDSAADEYIMYAVEGAKHMEQLIKDLLGYSQVGVNTREPQIVNSGIVLGRVLINLQDIINEADVIVTHDKMPEVYADDIQLGQVFQNLINNAIKFRKQTDPEIHISVKERDSEWIFAVKDNGIGIKNEYKDKIFDIFKRLHIKDEYAGTGVGLSVCKRIIEYYGGQIWLESEFGYGTTFYFTIPKK